MGLALAAALVMAADIGCSGDDDDAAAGSIDAAAAADASGPGGDGAPAADGASGDAGAFTCGDETCDPASEYCYQFQAGARAAGARIGCNRLPNQCDAPASCDCVLARVQTGCPLDPFCEDDGGRVVVICALP